LFQETLGLVGPAPGLSRRYKVDELFSFVDPGWLTLGAAYLPAHIVQALRL